MSIKDVFVIGAGFSGISAATTLADKGYNVKVFEKNEKAGGRARNFEAQGFTFDMGPSWYWMPDIFESYFQRFGKTVKDYYELIQLNPGFQIFFENDHSPLKIPAKPDEIYDVFENIEKGSAKKLEKFLKEGKYKYNVANNELIYKPGQSLFEFFNINFLKGIFKMGVFNSISHHVRKYFKDPRLIQLMEFPVLFLGAMPSKTPALYSLMNYAALQLGTWYPKGGFHKVVEGMVSLAREKGVQFYYNENIKSLEVKDNIIKHILVNDHFYKPDIVVGSADYHHIENDLLNNNHRNYDEKYWESRTMAPSSLIFYLGIDKKVENLEHHNLFFDSDFNLHADQIYKNPGWPEKPLFYVCCPSVSDNSVAPVGMDNIFILIPLAPGLKDTMEMREKYFNHVLERIKTKTGESLQDHIIYKRTYAHSDFIEDYNAFKGNAYGLANTLRQTAILKPSVKSKKVQNLYFTGQLTVPGPGVPPSLISGQITGDLIINEN